ncbi:MAG: purine-binding chemotaxis protein CheW [Blastocatellia bacterium]|jgi:purine-binding chemotaxis protein CheW|nr:purine-binding chemotaxis protein CheW [Blastocatellia bacterium]
MNDNRSEHDDEQSAGEETGFNIFVEGQNDDRPRRDLLIVKCGHRTFGIFADETDGIFDWKSPTPLPDAPKSILGVINARGRILTVLDPVELFGEPEDETLKAKFVVSLHGDEQLGVAVDRVLQITEIVFEEVVSLRPGEEQPPFIGTIQIDELLVRIVEPTELFKLATRGADRWRDRT